MDSTEILWDTWGVPHIYGPDLSKAYFALGWAQMKSRGELLLRNYRRVSGETAADAYPWVRDQLSEELIACFQSFADGINAYCNAHLNSLDSLEKAVLPINSEDVLHYFQWLNQMTFSAQSPLMVWDMPATRSPAGNPMKMVKYNLPWSGPALLYEAHLQSGKNMIYGVTWVGLPLFQTGFQRHFGWAHPVGEGRTYDPGRLLNLQEAGSNEKPDDKNSIPINLPRSFKEQKAGKLLKGNYDLTLSELIALGQSTRSETADRILDDLLDLERIVQDSVRKEAFWVLKNWDRTLEAESRGAVLFAHWFECLTRGNPFSQEPFLKKWDPASPYSTPDGLISPEFALECLTNTATDLLGRYQSLDLPWGSYYCLEGKELKLPARGGMEWLGTTRTLEFEIVEGGNMLVAGFGDAWMMALECGHSPVAKVLLTYGNASPNKAYRFQSQMQLFAKKQLRTAWIDRSTIEENLQEHEIIN